MEVHDWLSNLDMPSNYIPFQVVEVKFKGARKEFFLNNDNIYLEIGELVAVDGEKLAPVRAIQKLQAIAAPFGVGRDIHVGDTIIGIKGRVGFEAAGPMVIIRAHHALEKHTLTKWQLSWKENLSSFYGNWLHEGQFHDPIMRNIEAFLADTQKFVSGKVFVELLPYRFQVIGIESPYDLMSARFGKYGEMNTGFTGDDVRGFSKIFGNQTSIWMAVQASPNPSEGGAFQAQPLLI